MFGIVRFGNVIVNILFVFFDNLNNMKKIIGIVAVAVVAAFMCFYFSSEESCGLTDLQSENAEALGNDEEMRCFFIEALNYCKMAPTGTTICASYACGNDSDKLLPY